jgi:signal transduction histidine kinase
MSTAHIVKTIAIDERSPQYDAQDIVAHLAHELRQPLSAMESLSCYLEIVLPLHEAKARAQVSKMQELLRQTNWILSDAIHFLQAVRRHPVLMDWNETIMEIVSEGGATPGLDVEFFLDESIPPILFDLEQARHLTLGMYLFLRKLSRGKAIVNVTSKLLPGWVEVEFAAVAPEANLECCEALFEPFSQHAPAGSGLALASARQIVQAHGGSIKINTPELQTRTCGMVAISLRFPIQPRSQAHISEST